MSQVVGENRGTINDVFDEFIDLVAECGNLTETEAERMAELEETIRTHLGPRLVEHRVRDTYGDHTEWTHKQHDVKATLFDGDNYVRFSGKNRRRFWETVTVPLI